MEVKEGTISFLDLAMRFIKKWKLICISMLIGAVLFGGLGYVKSVKTAKAMEAQLTAQKDTDTEPDFSEYTQGLTKREITEVQTAASSYKEYQMEYMDSLSYYQNSVKMNLNPGCIPTVKLQYVIDTHYTVEYPVISKTDLTEDIINTFVQRVMSNDVNSDVARALGMEDKAAYIQELITAEYLENSLLNITIIAENQEQCEKISEIVKAKVAKETPEVKKIYGEFDITQTSDEYFENADNKLVTLQQQIMTSLNGLKTAVFNLTNGMTDAQKTYYYAILDKSTDMNTEEDDTNGVDLPEITVPEIKVLNVKYIVCGLCFGFVFCCGCIALFYVFGGRLRMTGDLEEVYGMSVLGSIADKKDRKLLKKPYDLLSEDERLEMIAAAIQITATKEKFRKIFITGTSTTQSCMELCEKIQQISKEKGLDSAWGKTALYDPTSAEKLSDADAVVFVEQIDISRYEDIEREIAMCNKYHVPVIGCVIAE